MGIPFQLSPGTHSIVTQTGPIGYIYVPEVASQPERIYWSGTPWPDQFKLEFNNATYVATNPHTDYPQVTFANEGSYSPGVNQHGTVWRMFRGSTTIGWFFRHEAPSITPGKVEWFSFAAHVNDNGRLRFGDTGKETLHFQSCDRPGDQTVLYCAQVPE